MNDESQLLQRIRKQLDSEIETQSPSVQGRLRAARREALAGNKARSSSHRLWVPAMAASLFAVVVSTSLWLQHNERSDSPSTILLQLANEADMQMINAGDDIELYQNLEFYYWLQQEQAGAV